MRKLSKTIEAVICDFSELTRDQQNLLREAAEARKRAQAPYSHYFVGVAVESARGNRYAGCNVERASWTQTTHAEQNAIDSMVAAEGPTKVTRIALVAGPENAEIVVPTKVARSEKIKKIDDVPIPCGHCLQIIWENCFADGEVEIIGLCRNGEIAITKMDSAFPIKFGPADLGIDYSKQTPR